MSHFKRFSALRLAMAFTCIAGSVLLPKQAAAQLVPVDDPCFKKLRLQGLSLVIVTSQWNDTQDIGFSLLKIREFAKRAEGIVTTAQRDVAAGKSLTAESLAQLKDLNECLPWLALLSSRIDDELKKRDIGILEPLPPEPRGVAKAVAEERARVAKETADALDKAIAGLRRVLKPR